MRLMFCVLILHQDEGPTPEMCASLSLEGGNLTHQLISCQILMFQSPTDAAQQFPEELNHSIMDKLAQRFGL